MKVPWCEYWEFLDAVVDIESVDGLRQFEMYLRRRLRELIDRRDAERQRQERLQNTSLCQLMQLLNLSNSSMHCGEPGTEYCQTMDNNVLPEEQHTVCMTWPPSLAKYLPHNTDAAAVTDSSLCEEAQILASTSLLNGSRSDYKPSDSLSTCSSDSFRTADDDSDLEFDLASDWPDSFDWQAVEPMFIYG